MGWVSNYWSSGGGGGGSGGSVDVNDLVSNKQDNALSIDNGKLFVNKAAMVGISTKDKNAISVETDGLYVPSVDLGIVTNLPEGE